MPKSEKRVVKMWSFSQRLCDAWIHDAVGVLCSKKRIILEEDEEEEEKDVEVEELLKNCCR